MKTKRQFKQLSFIYNDRKAILEMPLAQPDKFNFRSGMFLAFDKSKYSLSMIGKVQKQLRQEYYQWLCSENRQNEFYLVIIDAPLKSASKETYIELSINGQSEKHGDLKSNEVTCQYFLERVKDLLKDKTQP